MILAKDWIESVINPYREIMGQFRVLINSWLMIGLKGGIFLCSKIGARVSMMFHQVQISLDQSWKTGIK